MKSSQIITLFAEPSPPRTAPSSFLVSILVHGAGFGLLLIGLKHTSRISDPSVIKRYTVRLLTPRRTEPQPRHSARGGVAYPDPQSVARALAPGGSPAPLPYVPPQVAQLLPASQTLVQPDAPPDLLLPQETPIPVLVMWSRDSTLSKKIVPPPPQEATVADVRPSLIKPNHESNLADLNISATAFPTVAPAVPASTTAPLVVRGPEPIKQVPQTSSQPLEQPTPARVMSISDLQTQGPVMIPLANQTSQSASTESLAPRRPEKSSGEGNGNPASKQNGIGAGQSSGDQGAKAATGGGSVAQNGADTGPGQGSDAGLGSSSEPSLPAARRGSCSGRERHSPGGAVAVRDRPAPLRARGLQFGCHSGSRIYQFSRALRAAGRRLPARVRAAKVLVWRAAAVAIPGCPAEWAADCSGSTADHSRGDGVRNCRG